MYKSLRIVITYTYTAATNVAHLYIKLVVCQICYVYSLLMRANKLETVLSKDFTGLSGPTMKIFSKQLYLSTSVCVCSSRWEANHKLMIESKVNRSLLKEMVANANIRFRYVHVHMSVYCYAFYHFSLSIEGTNVRSFSQIWIHRMFPCSSFQLGLEVKSTCSRVNFLLVLCVRGKTLPW